MFSRIPSGSDALKAGKTTPEQVAAATPTPDTQALAGVLAAADPGDQITLTVIRATQELTVKLTLGELPGS